MKKLVLTTKNLQQTISSDKPVSLYGLKNKTIKTLIITLGRRSDPKVKEVAFMDSECDGMVIEKLILKGNPDQTSKQSWMDTDFKGIMLNSPGAVIKHLYVEGIHIPLQIMGAGAVCEYLHTLNTSGDGFQVCGDNSKLLKADISGLLDVYPYHIEHSDVGMLFPVRGRPVLTGAKVSNVKLIKSGHKWEHPSPQGILAPDDTCEDCHVFHSVLNGVHKEHGVRFGHARNCSVVGVQTDGAIAFGDRKPTKNIGVGNEIVWCDTPLEEFEDNSQLLVDNLQESANSLQKVEEIPGKAEINLPSKEPAKMNSTIYNRKVFFDKVRKSLFGGSLTSNQVGNIELILNYWEQNHPAAIPAWVARTLSTVFHETAATMEPIIERGGDNYLTNLYGCEGGRPDRAIRHGNTSVGDGVRYSGKGHPQLTWKCNYEFQGKKHGIDLVNEPELMLVPEISVAVMIEGMIDGDFTGKSLQDYTDDKGKFDSYNSRRIINRMVPKDAKKIQGYYNLILAALNDSKSYEEAKDLEVEPISKPSVKAEVMSQSVENEDIFSEAQFKKETTISKTESARTWLSGKKTHLGMLISGCVGIAGMFGFIPTMSAEAGATILQHAFTVSGTRSAVPKILKLAIELYMSNRR